MPDNKKDERVVPAWHPLLTREIGSISTWEEWKKFWAAARTKQELIGLLHCGFDTWVLTKSHEEDVERICFYLDHADGRKDDIYLTIPDEVWRPPYGMAIYEEKAPAEVARRIEVARKAWRMLVDKFFRDTRDPKDRYRDDYRYPSWMKLAVHPAVFEKLLWFFGNPEKHKYPSQESNFPNERSEKHEDEVATKFLIEFTEFAWRFDGSRDNWIGGRESKDVVVMFAAGRPRVLRIMQNVDNLWVFVRDPCLMAKLNAASRATLKELALRRYDKVRWTTLEEAYTSGHSLAALVLLTASSYRREIARKKVMERRLAREEEAYRDRQEREREIADALRAKDEAEHRLQELGVTLPSEE